MIQLGLDKNVAWNGTPIAISGYDYDNSGDLVDVTNTSTQGIQALLAGIKRGGGSFKWFFDPTGAAVAAALTFGMSGILTFVNGGTPDSIPCIIEKVGRRSVVNGAVEVEVSVKVNFFAQGQ